MVKKEFVGFKLDSDLRDRLNAEAERSGRLISEVVREALIHGLQHDPIVEGVIENLVRLLVRERADIIECLLIKHIAADMARLEVHPDTDLILDWAAFREADGQPLRGKDLFQFLKERYVAQLRKQPNQAPRRDVKILKITGGKTAQVPFVTMN